MNNHTEDLLQQATKAHQKGELDSAKLLYEKILKLDPDHLDANQLLGILSNQQGNYSNAIAYMKKAIEIDPSIALFHFELGNFYSYAGEFGLALESYQHALNLEPESPVAHHNLGAMLLEQDDTEGAIAAFKKAIELKPDFALAYENLCNLLRDMHKNSEALKYGLDAIAKIPDNVSLHFTLATLYEAMGETNNAISSYKKAISLDNRHAPAYNNLGILLQQQTKYSEAESCYLQAIELNPTYAEAYNNLGTLFKDKQDLEKALEYYNKALKHDPTLAAALCNLGVVFQAKHNYTDAKHFFLKSLELNPKASDTYYYNLGTLYCNLNQMDEAEIYFNKAIAINPEHAESHYGKALMLLSKGDFKAGWDEYEWRWAVSHGYTPIRQYTAPRWEDESLKGKKLLVYYEQGYGDTIQFIRYVNLLKTMGPASIIIDAQKNLKSLVSRIDGISKVVTIDDPLQPHDYCIPLLSLPRIFKTELATIPNQIPYLSADPIKEKHWQDYFSAFSNLKVGLCWAGSPLQRNNYNRSAGLKAFLALLTHQKIHYFSLQKELMPGDKTLFPAALQDPTLQFHDLDDAAAFISHLDLVISVDTVITHLAGAMGKRTFVLLPYEAGWRWLLDRTDSPWYPTARLFRQTIPGEWDDVIQSVISELNLTIPQ